MNNLQTATGTAPEISEWLVARGLTDDDLAALEAILQVFALSTRSAATYSTVQSVGHTYLGKDAGQRMLDDYLDAIVRGVLQRGGEVLKFLGDGVLAVFEISDDDTECQIACQKGTAGGQNAFAAIDALNGSREAQGQPTMALDLTLHIGDVLYGNVGAEGRLDFTVIDPAANEASRIETLCGTLDRNWLAPESFYLSARHCSDAMEPMGQHQLHGLTGEWALYSLPQNQQEAGWT